MAAFAAAVLLFLLVDSIRHALRATHLMAGAYQGIMLFVIGAAAAFVGVGALSVWWRRRAAAGERGTYAAWTLGVTVAIGIGLSNLARGVEVGTDLAQGEMVLRGVTIVGLTLQSLLAGAAISAALAGTRERFAGFVGLLLVAGAPAVLGLWLGGLQLTSPVATALVGLGAGGVAAAIPTLAVRIASDRPLHEALATPRVVAGAMVGLVAMYVGALLAI
jgi:ZIP family zinc transporter